MRSWISADTGKRVGSNVKERINSPVFSFCFFPPVGLHKVRLHEYEGKRSCLWVCVCVLVCH